MNAIRHMIAESYQVVPPHIRNGTGKAWETGMNAISYCHNASLDTRITERIPFVMAASTLFLILANGLVITAPQWIPAWLLVGASVAAIFTLYYAKRHDKTPFYLLINVMASLFIGVTGPRPFLQYAFKIQDFADWYPETFMLLGTVFGLAGFTLIHTIHTIITGQLPAMIQSIVDKFVKPKPPTP